MEDEQQKLDMYLEQRSKEEGVDFRYLGSHLHKNKITVKDFQHFRENPNDLKDLFPVLRERIDFTNAMKKAMISMAVQVNFDPPCNPRVNLMEICATSDKGREFIEIYNRNNKTFTAECREPLKIALVDHFYRIYRGVITLPVFQEMVSMIKTNFPREKDFAWYAPAHEGMSAGGILHFRYRYLQQNKKINKKSKEEAAELPPTKKQQIEIDAIKNYEALEKVDQAREIVSKHKINAIGLNRRTEIADQWDFSFILRRYEAVRGELDLKDWDFLNGINFAYELLSQDFRKIFSINNDMMLELVPRFVTRFSKIVMEYKSCLENEKELFVAVKATFMKEHFVLSEHAMFLAFFCLPFILRKKFITVNNRRVSLSIADNCQSFIVLVKTEAVLHEEKENLLARARKRGESVQPFIIAVGSVYEIRSYFVILDQFTFPCKSISIAVDLLFKLHYVFHIEYAVKCEPVYEFLERFFYLIVDENERGEPSVLFLITDLDRDDD